MDFIAFDLETTGIQAGIDRIVEIGAVRFVDGEAQTPFNELVNPQCIIPEEAIAIHKITNEEVQDKPLVKDLLGPFSDYCGTLPLVAHNGRFDFKFLEAAIKREKTKAPGGLLLDTFALSKVVFPGIMNYRLETLTKHFEFPNTVFHRACEDAEYCGKIFLRILETLQRSEQPCDTAALLELSSMKEMRLPKVAVEADQLGLF